MDDQILIPRKSRDFVYRYAQSIHPLLASDGAIYFIDITCDHFSQSYPWNARRLGKATDLVEVGRITTYHVYGYYGFFKPSVAEVIRQIPEELLEEVEFFLVQGPNDTEDLNEQWDVIKQGYHRATTILYRRMKEKR